MADGEGHRWAGEGVQPPGFGDQLNAALQRTLTSERTLTREKTVSDRQGSGSESGDAINDFHNHHDPRRPRYDEATRQPSRLQLEEGSKWPTKHAWQTYFMQEVAKDHYLEAQLLWMTVATGCLDTMTYTTYSVFASKMTGNVMFLALYALRHPTIGVGVEKNVGISIGVFIVGAIFFGHIGHFVRQRRRLWVLATNLFQTILILAATAVRYWGSRAHVGPGAEGILALLALAFSAQIALALCVQMPELNTTMVTGALIQLCTDGNFFKVRNVGRNRRLLFCISLLCGCFIGSAALVFKSPTCALLLCGCIKAVGTFSFLFNYGIIEQVVSVEEAKPKLAGTATPVSKILWGD